MDTTNAKMMLGYMDDDDDDEILDYDGNLDLSTDNEDEDEAESVQDYTMQQYPETPDEKIHWQEQIRMIHLRSHLNQLMEKVRHAHYVTDKTREELKKCRSQIQQYEAERDQLFAEIQNKETDGNKSAVHRIRAAHQRVCRELEGEQNLEKMIIERLDQAEYDLALAEVERGKFLLAEDDLLQREHKLSQEKTDMAMVRLAKEETLARQALTHRRKEDRLKQRETEEAERYKTDMSKKMDMLLKLKSDIAHNRENLQAIRARDKAAERKEKEEEREEREKIKMQGGNPEEMLLVKKRRNELEKQRSQFEVEQKVKKAAIMQKILREEENIKRRRQQQPYLWDSPEKEMELRVKPLPLKPVQALEDYMKETADYTGDADVGSKEEELLVRLTLGKQKKTEVRSRGVAKSPSKKQQRETSLGNQDASSESIEVSKELSRSSSETFIARESYLSLLRRLSEDMQTKYKVSEDKLSSVADSVQYGQNKNQSRDSNDLPSENQVNDVESIDNDLGKEDEMAEGLLDQTEADVAADVEETFAAQEQHIECASPVKDSDDSDDEEDLQATLNLARPEFEGLWDKETKPYRIPKDTDCLSTKPVGSSKMEQNILKKTLEKTREGIVITQVAAGREFTGCPFYSKPGVIHFKDFVVGKTYKKKVTLTNVSYTVNYIKYLDITERLKDFIKIHFDPPGQMSAGLTCDMTVTFKPMINEDLEGEVNFLTQTGPFHIPLICSTKKCDLVLDTKCVDFGTTVIGETLKQTFTLTNRGALGTKFDFFKVTGMKQRTLTTAGTSLGRMSESDVDLEIVDMQMKSTGPENTFVISKEHTEHTAPVSSMDVPLTTSPEPTLAGTPAVYVSSRQSPVPKTTDSMRAVSLDSPTDLDPNSKAKQTTGTGSSVAVESKKKSEEALDKIPEAGETSVPPLDEIGKTGPGAGDEPDTASGEMAADDAAQKQEGDSEEAMSPDLAVSDMEEYASLDGMRVGHLPAGEIGPFSSVKLEIIWQPTLPGRVDPEFVVSFADPLSVPLSIRAIANAIDVPVWVERPTVDLKICMFDRLYQDTILVNNRATTALRLKFEVCKELKNHLELLPKTGYVQAQSQFSAQLKFLPRQSLFKEAAKYFDAETGVLEAPMTIRVADQTTPVHFTVQAVVTTSDLEFDVSNIDFGFCTIHESVKRTVKLTNHSILPQQFGFIGLPEYMEVQPNDGFGTLLPLETLELDVIFSPNKAREYKLDLVCRSLINRDFKISMHGVGVLTPLELTNQVLHFSATPLYDTATNVLHVVNSHTSSNEFTHPVPRIGKGEICPVGPTSFEFVVPKDSPITVSPSVGTVMPGETCRIQVRFSPTLSDYDIRQEALRIYTRMEAAREEKEKLEAEEREKREAEEKTVSSFMK
ncbi:cilia- and flagella-associated protein 74 [Elysia marginata]|uniref:Cilia- and flagella-associated protein 74 n=1 Tax=Elysia marginata TaxID=1093978 RepID=A0AAV4EV38_9GAST|nr:cilia- and flagella-associated protein 74 [Elysia marginata]